MSRVITWEVGIEKFRELVELLDNGHLVDYGILFEDGIELDNGDRIVILGIVPDVPEERNDFGYVQFDYVSDDEVEYHNDALYSEDIFNGAKLNLIDAHGNEFVLRINVKA